VVFLAEGPLKAGWAQRAAGGTGPVPTTVDRSGGLR
jgi:hypothetical protein